MNLFAYDDLVGKSDIMTATVHTVHTESEMFVHLRRGFNNSFINNIDLVFTVFQKVMTALKL